MLIEKTDIVWSKKIKKLCGNAYPLHKHGCPNYNVKGGCPMNNKDITELMDISKSVYVIGVSFDLEAHRNMMHKKHPIWSFRQCNNLLYWQSRQRKHIRLLVEDFLKQHPGLVVDFLPEGHGVNVTTMMKKLEKPLDWKYPLHKVWRIAILGRSL